MEKVIDKKRSPQVMPERMFEAEYQRTQWVADVEVGVKVEDLANPAFWAHVSSKMRPYDHVEVRAEDGTWMAQLLVLACDRNWAKLHLLHHHNLTTSDVSLSQAAKYDVQYKGPHKKHCVVRLADGEEIKTGISTKDEAHGVMREYEKTVG
jgi:hypothetical protein